MLKQEVRYDCEVRHMVKVIPEILFPVIPKMCFLIDFYFNYTKLVYKDHSIKPTKCGPYTHVVFIH